MEQEKNLTETSKSTRPSWGTITLLSLLTASATYKYTKSLTAAGIIFVGTIIQFLVGRINMACAVIAGLGFGVLAGCFMEMKASRDLFEGAGYILGLLVGIALVYENIKEVKKQNKA